MAADRFADALARSTRFSPFLRRAIERRPEVAAALTAGDVNAAFTAAPICDQPTARALRIERLGVALAVAIGDLAGALPFEAVVARLSDFADSALDRAIAAAFAERYPGEPPRGFAAIALGKHGSQELNYSSDIDPILIFDPETLPRRAREEPGEAAVRLARRVVELLQARDADGYVLRVDLRLRPSPEVTPIALPVDAAISYYESAALPWERAAFIRARAAAGDLALGRSFLAAIKPFIWRRALDFGAIDEIRGISRRIRAHHGQVRAVGPGYDLKRARGGIREIEFFAQIHQLIHGGREPTLRAPATLDALAALAAAGRVDREAALRLADAYRLHRTIEHRLQMIDDRQTHELPRDPAALDAVAGLHGLAEGAALVALLKGPVEMVGRIYDALDDRSDRLPEQIEALAEALRAAGFADPAPAAQHVRRWREGSIRALRSDAARAALEDVLPGLIGALGAAPDPLGAMNRLDDIVRRLPTAINLFRLLEARPALARLIADLLSHAPTLAEALGRRPALLDGLIDATALALPPSVDALAAEFGEVESGADYEQTLDAIRAKVGERRFALGAQLIEGAGDPLDVASGYSRVAEAALQALASATVRQFEAAHGRIAGGELAIIALGRLGGGALTHASDLDLIYLFTGDHLAESDGAKPLGAVHYFNRLAQRVTAALSVPTAAGALYDIDTRLRPSGGQGPLSVSIAGFARYQRESAWTWEHMALTRARTVFGSPRARAETETIIGEVLAAPRDPAVLIADAVKMRADMARHKPPAGPLDVKLIEGGLIDLEFCVHVAQLRHRIGLTPDLDRAIDELAAAGVVSDALIEAHRLLMRMLVTLRLVAPAAAPPAETTRALVARACRQPDWDSLLAAYDAARACVKACWRRVVAETEGDPDAR